MSKTSIFFIGATGYIGGTVLTRLLAHPDAANFEISVLVRSPEKAKILETFGVKPVIGSFKDLALVEKLSEEAHVVFSLGDSDDIEAIQAILKGLKNRHAKTGDVPILVHTSGTGVVCYGDALTKGLAASDTIFDDTNLEQLASIPPTAIHRPVDLIVMQADKDGYANTGIVVPGIVYGVAQTPFVDAGIQKAHTIAISLLSKAAKGRRRAGYVGKGLSLWSTVNVDDVADLHVLVYDALVAGLDKTGQGTSGYYFGESGEQSHYNIAQAIGKALLELGLSETEEPSPFTPEEMTQYFGSELLGEFFGANARARGTRSRSIGWTPKKDASALLGSVKPQIEHELKLEQKN